MHLSDTLVIGPLPLRARTVRLPVGTALAIAAALLVAAAVAVRPPLPGGAITDLQVLADGRLGLAVASLVGPTERQAWVFDPAQASLQRVGQATRDAAPPAGVIVAPDGQHAIALMRGAAATSSTPATPDSLVLDGP